MSKLKNVEFQSLGALFSFARKDVEIEANAPTQLLLELHSDFISAYEQKKDSYVSYASNFTIFSVKFLVAQLTMKLQYGVK